MLNQSNKQLLIRRKSSKPDNYIEALQNLEREILSKFLIDVQILLLNNKFCSNVDLLHIKDLAVKAHLVSEQIDNDKSITALASLATKVVWDMLIESKNLNAIKLAACLEVCLEIMKVLKGSVTDEISIIQIHKMS